MKSKIKLVVFDLWQTLAYRKGDYAHNSCKEMLKKTNTKIPLKKFIKIFESSLQTKKWKSEFEAYKNLCHNMRLETTKKNINLLKNIRTKAERKTNLYSHTIPILKKLKLQGYKIGLISNSTPFSIKHKEIKKLLKHIDYPLFSFDIKTIKPNLKAYKKILKIAKIKPHETIMVGDKMEDDVKPPRKIGMHSIHFKDYNQLKENFKKFAIII